MIAAGAVGVPAYASSLPKKINLSGSKSDRNVWIASLTQDGIAGSNYKEATQAAIKQMEYALPFSPDIYCLPEVFHVANLKNDSSTLKETAEDGSGKIIAPFQLFAKAHSCYIICSVYTQHHGKFYNAAILIDREGKVIGEYQKTRLTVNEMNKGLTPGSLTPPIFKTDFGTIGMQICHDIQWSGGWEQLGEK